MTSNFHTNRITNYEHEIMTCDIIIMHDNFYNIEPSSLFENIKIISIDIFFYCEKVCYDFNLFYLSGGHCVQPMIVRNNCVHFLPLFYIR